MKQTLRELVPSAPRGRPVIVVTDTVVATRWWRRAPPGPCAQIVRQLRGRRQCRWRRKKLFLGDLRWPAAFVSIVAQSLSRALAPLARALSTMTSTS